MTDKKVVRVESDDSDRSRPTWQPSQEAGSSATRLRVAAFVLWLLAIAAEVYAIFWVLPRVPVNMVLLIGLLVGIALLAGAGSLLWKKANRLDPASRSNGARFFVQNQLGAIMTVLAFLPLIVLILLNKDMSGKEKALAGGVGAVLMVVATLVGVDWDPVSVEQYDAETNKVIEITGQDLVYWTKEGEVFHLCEDASAVNLESKDNTIYSGTVADAHAEGKDRLTLQVEQEARQCGYAVPGEAGAGTEAE